MWDRILNTHSECWMCISFLLLFSFHFIWVVFFRRTFFFSFRSFASSFPYSAGYFFFLLVCLCVVFCVQALRNNFATTMTVESLWVLHSELWIILLLCEIFNGPIALRISMAISFHRVRKVCVYRWCRYFSSSSSIHMYVHIIFFLSAISFGRFRIGLITARHRCRVVRFSKNCAVFCSAIV